MPLAYVALGVYENYNGADAFYSSCELLAGHVGFCFGPYDVAGIVAVFLGLVLYRSKSEPPSRSPTADDEEELYFAPAGTNHAPQGMA